MKTPKVTAQLTQDGTGIGVKFEGDVSYQTSVAFGNAILLRSIEAFKEFSLKDLKKEEQQAYLMTMYDDLNQRFSNMLEEIIPDEELPIDFTEEAQRALADEDEYIDLKFKALQYEKIVEQAKKDKRDYVKVTLNEKGEFKV